MRDYISPLLLSYKKYREPIHYIIIGGLTTLVNFLAYAACTRLFFMGTASSTTIATVIAVAFAFVTNKVWVFRSKKQGAGGFLFELFTFSLARLLSYFINLWIMLYGVEALGINDYIVFVFAQVVVIVFNYIASKLVIFKK